MSLNIIDLIKGQLGPALVSQAASQLGESESGISKAIGGLLPAVVGGLANNANNPSVLDAISGAASSGLLSNLLGGSNNSIVTTVINALFGDKLGGLLGGVSKFAGVSESTSGSLLNMVTGAALGTVGKYAADNNLGASGISSLLGEQKGLVSALLPAGLSLASFGLDVDNWFDGAKESVSSAAASAKESISDTFETAKEKISVTRDEYTNNNSDGGGSIWKWLLPLLLLLLAGWFIWKQCNNKNADAAASEATVDSTASVVDSLAGAVDSTVTAVVNKVDEAIDLNGVSLKGYKGGLEDRMISFLKSDGYKNAADDAALKETWYDFDHVNFKMGSSSELEAGSQQQLDNLVAILKAFPNTKVKIGGYTDKTGDEAVNKKISQERADYIKNYLAKAGVGAQVAGAEGYGSEFAKVPAEASDAERAADRKMSVRFAK
ncbi:MAG: OmpA family protein [Bergeyella sp.]